MQPDDIRIETPRLILRPLRLQDFDAWAAFTSDPEATRFLGGPQPRAAAWRSFMTMAGAWYLSGFAMFSILDRATGAWLGRLGPWMPEGWPGTEVGWGLVPKYWGRGYATEGAAAAIDWSFDYLGWTEVIHAIAPDNLASQEVARRLGSVNRGPGSLPAPLENFTVDIWSQSREQWRGRRSA